MKKVLLYGPLLLLMAFSPQAPYRSITNYSFDVGEKLEYRVHYGLLNAATATMVVSDKIQYRNNRPCYKVDVYGKSVGVFDLITRINDNWGTYIDTAAIIPHRFYRNIEEGRYRKYEIVDFDHQIDEATTITLDKKTKEPRTTTKAKVPDNVQDMVSGYYFMRTLDFSKMTKGQVITVDAFFDEERFDFKIRYMGRQSLRTKLGRFNTIVLQPIMPENSLFKWEDAIKVWLSDDINKIPLKIKASLFVGAVEIDIKRIIGARNWVPVLE